MSDSSNGASSSSSPALPCQRTRFAGSWSASVPTGLALLRVRRIERVRLHVDLVMLGRLLLALSRTRASQRVALIPAEIASDSFSEIIEEVASSGGVHEILEIGSSAGDGSTAAWVRGALRNAVRPRLHCIEVSTERHAALVERWGAQGFVH